MQKIGLQTKITTPDTQITDKELKMTTQQITEFQEFLGKKESEILERISLEHREIIKLVFNIIYAELDLKAEIEGQKEAEYFGVK